MMEALLSLFPTKDFALFAVVLGMPLIGAFVNGVFGHRLGREAVRFMGLAALAVSFVAAVFTFSALDHYADASKLTATAAGEVAKYTHVKLSWTAWDWLYTSGPSGTQIPIALKFSVDALSGIMMLVITGVGFLIHLYASSYMWDDKSYARFFAYLNLFVFSMLVLVLADNLPLLFVGWEGVGLCSYLLIGFWYGHMPNAAAGKKAFIANRIGDFGLICAMFLLVHYVGALDWEGIEAGVGSLVTLPDATDVAGQNQVHIWPIGGGQFTGWLTWLQPAIPITFTAATAVAIMLLLGATGKSAQIPLYVWLPDAMAGPTPVSALIHAATMVTAGIYLVCRLSFVFVLSPGVMATIAIVGAATAFLAATIALVQNDIKKVLAYSTVSQLGFMFLGVGMGAFTAGFFHVFTHAFFKACLFLGAGSVIHGMHARIHDDDKAQDMRNMGGLRQYMPITYWTFLVATLAIIGFPLTSGFFSKDEILFKTMTSELVYPNADKLKGHAELVQSLWGARGAKTFYIPPASLGVVLYWVGLAAATMTAFYMCRVLFLTFFGKFRGWKLGRPSMVGVASHGDHGHHDDLTTPGYAPHESPRAMTIPLIILASAAAFAGFLNPAILKHVLHVLGVHALPLEHWLEPLFEESIRVGIKTKENAEHLEWLCTAGAFGAFATGAGLSYWVYMVKGGEPAKQWAQAFPKLHRLAMNKWFVDEFYDASVLSGVDALADTAISVDRGVVDGILGKLSGLVVAALGTLFRVVQTGVVHVYSAMMVVGLAGMGWFLVVPHADARILDQGNGSYQLEAGGGLGYSYVWSDAELKETEVFTGKSTYVVPGVVESGATKTIHLRVKNAFDMSAEKAFIIARPEKPELRKVGRNDDHGS
jgi:NADH-quinone oxidoreductase subunit L